MRLAGGVRDHWQRSAVLRVVCLVAALVIATEVAIALLAPGEPGIEPVPVDPEAELPAEQIERASAYRDGQRLLFVAGLLCQLVTVGALALGWPRRLGLRLRALAGRPIIGPAAAGALVVVVARLAALPARLAAHERAVDYGTSVRDLGGWLVDAALSAAITAAIVAVACVVLAALVRRFPRGWWLPAAAGFTALAVLVTVIGPVVIAPRFNEFTKLREGSELRTEVIELGERAGVDIGEVYQVDASRRSRTLNAYIGGLGPSKRVVLYDTLIARAARPELRAVVAHELGHLAHSDLARGLTFVAIVAPFGMLLARELALMLTRRAGVAPGTAAGIPALLVAISVVAFLVEIPGNRLSREVEASADAFALRITGEPQGFADLQRRTAAANLSDPEPPGWWHWAFATHPTVTERIGSALAYERR